MLLAALFAIIAILAVGIYRLGWYGPVIQNLKIFPLPAAKVNGHYISIGELNRSGGKSALDALIREKIITELAREREVSADEIEIELVRSSSEGKAAYQMARIARNEISSGKDFADVAASYSDDEASKYIAGEIGFLSYQDLPVWSRDRIFALDIGQTSEAIPGPDGYYVFQVSARDDENTPARKHIRQIYLKVDSGLEQLVRERERASKIYVYIKE